MVLLALPQNRVLSLWPLTFFQNIKLVYEYLQNTNPAEVLFVALQPTTCLLISVFLLDYDLWPLDLGPMTLCIFLCIQNCIISLHQILYFDNLLRKMNLWLITNLKNRFTEFRIWVNSLFFSQKKVLFCSCDFSSFISMTFLIL